MSMTTQPPEMPPVTPQSDSEIDPGASEITPSRTLRLTVAYDGTNYCGWQIQPNGTSIQAVVEQALQHFCGEPVKAVASGRTDAGVHAIGQVISFRTRLTAPCHAFLHGLAQYLPEDIVIRDAQEAPAGFNARFDAKTKWYRYLIHNSPLRLPHLRHAVLWQRSRLNDVAMHEAVQCLVGTHDFRCFETQWPNRSSSVRTVFRAQVRRLGRWSAWNPSDNASPGAREWLPFTDSTADGNDAEFIAFDIEADGFLYNMVRAIMGTLIHVGRGRWSALDLEQILTQGDRTHAGETAPPQGLYLMRVTY